MQDIYAKHLFKNVFLTYKLLRMSHGYLCRIYLVYKILRCHTAILLKAKYCFITAIIVEVRKYKGKRLMRDKLSFT